MDLHRFKRVIKPGYKKAHCFFRIVFVQAADHTTRSAGSHLT